MAAMRVTTAARTSAILLGLLVATACKEPGSSPAPAANEAPPPPPAPSVAPGAAASASAAPSATAATATPDTIIAQHLLVIYKGAKRAPKTITRSKADAKARAQEALAKIQAGTSFEDAVKQYSDDTGTVDRLGSLGKFHRDDMDPAFAAAAFALKVGGVSDVVETAFGFHVIKRTQ
jgi:NIMA-interacting peptidyl-prolyl cis-trans isomerase 1